MTKLSVTKAAEIREAAKRDEARIKTDLERTAPILKDYFRTSGKPNWKGRIGFAQGSRLQMDNDAVKAELGERVTDFQKRVTFETLSLLK